MTYLKKPGSPRIRKPASLEGGKEAYERMPTGKPIVPRIRLVKPEAAEREFQGVQQSPRETAGTSFFFLAFLPYTCGETRDVQTGPPGELTYFVQVTFRAK